MSTVQGADLPPAADYALLIVDALGQVVPWEYNGVSALGPATDLASVLASAAFRRHVTARSPGQIPECVDCEVEVRHDDTVETLSARILVEEHRLYAEAIRLVLNGGWRIEGRRFVYA